MMESLFQNSISQFDLNLFDHASSAIPTTVVPNTVARKQCLRFLKSRWKQVSDLVKRGKEANRVLEEIQKQLFEKNEECKELCNERNTLFNQTTESVNEIQELMTQKKLLEEQYSDAINSVAASKIYTMQFKELTIQLQKVQNNLKETDRNRIKEKNAREIADKRLKRVLSEFVSPKKKIGNKWIQKLLRKYEITKEGTKDGSSEEFSGDETFDDDPMLPPNCKSKELEVIKKSSVTTGDADDPKQKRIDCNIVLTTNNTVVNKHVSVDFENVGSVDTGRGSSLAFSDGEKSFHSPDYYMNDESPFSTAPNLCNKCNISRSDVGTSPIPKEMLDDTEISVVTTSDACCNTLNTDACTCHGPRKGVDVATETSDILTERYPYQMKADACTSPVKAFNIIKTVCDSNTKLLTTTSTNTDPLINEKQTMNPLETIHNAIQHDKYNASESNGTGASDKELPTSTIQLSTNTTSSPEPEICENSIQNNEVQTVGKTEVSSRRELDMKVECWKLNESDYCDDDYDLDTYETSSIDTESINDLNSGVFDVSLNVKQIVDQHESSPSQNIKIPTIPAKLIENIKPNLELNISGHTPVETEYHEVNIDDNNMVCDSYSNHSKSMNLKDVADSSILDSPVEDITIIHVAEETIHDKDPTTSKSCITEHNYSNKELFAPPEILIHETIEPKINISEKPRERECLELNNSKNLSIDNGTDMEIEMIINKMTLRHRLISPLPQSPSKVVDKETKQLQIVSSNDLGKNIDHGTSYSSTEGIDEYLNLIRIKTREAMGLFGCIPGFVESVIHNLSNDKENQELLRCLLQKGHNSSNHEKSNENMQTDDDEDIESSINTQTAIVNCNDVFMLGTAELRKMNDTIVYENAECDSDDDSPQQNRDYDTLDQEFSGSNKATGNTSLENCRENNHRRVKPKKMSKLQKLKLNMVRKCKIRPELTKTVKKLEFKPKPLIHTVKKTVTEADSAATLNDKAVYDNAVKVIAESKSSTNVPRVLVKDCIVSILKSPKYDQEIAQISPNSIKYIKRNLLPNFEDVYNTNVEVFQKQRKLKKDDTLKAETVACKRVLRSSCSLEKSDTENSSIVIRGSESVIALNNEPDKNSRKRTISDRQFLDKKSVCNTKETEITRRLDENDRDRKLIKTKRRGICSIETSNSQINNKDVSNIVPATDDDNSDREMVRTKRRGICSHDTSNKPINNNDANTIVSGIVDKKNKDQELINKKGHTICSLNSSSEGSNKNLPNISSKPDLTKKSPNEDHLSCDETPKCNNETELLSNNDVPSPINNSPVHKRRKISCHKSSNCSSPLKNKQEIESMADNNDVAFKCVSTRKNTKVIADINATVTPQRILRSSKQNKYNNVPFTEFSNDNNVEALQAKSPNIQKQSNECESVRRNKRQNSEINKNQQFGTLVSVQNKHNTCISYTDLEMFSSDKDCVKNDTYNNNTPEPAKAYQKNILCSMIEKYGVKSGFHAKKLSETVINDKWDRLEKSLDSIIDLPHGSCTDAMNKLVAEIRVWNVKHFITALLKYLKNPQRKIELFKKTMNPPAPPMTKKEQVLIYVIDQLRNNWCRGIIEKILENIEYTLFTLNRTPETAVIEAMSHFYALICRFYHKQSKLRLFVIDAMYCLSYKSIPLVKQCLEEWMFILPLGHMSLAKSPLVACLVYLLHFYKCEKDSSQCVQEMRTILNRKYYYDFSEWNETKVLDMFRTSIKELRDCELEKKMLRMALIILAKRNGPKWCQSNIISNMLQPLIENDSTSGIARRFCILVLGPLVKPYPNDMKSYSEIVAQYLIKKLDQNNSQNMQEAIISSLLFMNKHNSWINDFLLKWCPDNVSPEFEDILKDYVRSKPVKVWKFFLTSNHNNSN